MKRIGLSETKYNDVRFFLLFIVVANAFNYYLTYNNIRFNGFFIMTFAIDTVQGWIAWYIVRSIIIWLDGKIPYNENPGKRIAIQVLTTTIVGIGSIAVMTEICSLLIRGKWAGADFYVFDLIIISIWFLLMNGIYIGLNYYHEWQQSETSRVADKKLKATGFYVKIGKQDLVVPFNDITGFYSDDGFSYLHTTAEKTYLTEASLDKTEQLVPDELFFRVNRKHLIHRNTIVGYKRIEDGKLEVSIKPFANVSSVLPVSRIRAVPFKKWFVIGATA
jgi:DNA-binding LytR/AlgR family response regulator